MDEYVKKNKQEVMDELITEGVKYIAWGSAALIGVFLMMIIITNTWENFYLRLWGIFSPIVFFMLGMVIFYKSYTKILRSKPTGLE
ncbi:MAG: hypothetical protein ACOC44_19770, partial [Promethearchaeia archaeon]